MRRVFVTRLAPGPLALDPEQAHHLRDVLRAEVGQLIDLFDAEGRSARGRITSLSRDGVTLDASDILDPAPRHPLTVASAVPKNERADWLVEKLSEIGVARWIPLQTARSVVHPSGSTKFDRWKRIAIESAKQSRRAGVLEIGELTRVADLSIDGNAAVLSTRAGCVPLASIRPSLLLIGPEGGWTDDELDAIRSRGAAETSLTSTILRIETAAIVAAGVCACGSVVSLPR